MRQEFFRQFDFYRSNWNGIIGFFCKSATVLGIVILLESCSGGFNGRNVEEAGSGNPQPLLWETSQYGSPLWSKFVFKLIRQDLASEFLPGTDDIEEFCPRYRRLSDTGKARFWSLLVSAIVKFESGFNPKTRFLEPGKKIDSITGQPVYSEGLLQLSYQDTKWAPFCQFDWVQDQQFSASDGRKTILDPYKNLDCGIRILARQIKSTQKIAAESNKNYWAVLIPGGDNSKVSEIQGITRSSLECHQ